MEQVQANPENQQANSAFEGGSFSIRYLSTDPEGLEFETKKAIGRTESLEGSLSLSDAERAAIKKSMPHEMRFNDVDEVNTAFAALKEAQKGGAAEAELGHFEEAYDAARQEYRNKGKKIGIRNLEREGDTIRADVQLVSFPVYSVFARPENAPAVQEWSAALGTAMVVRTADNKIIVQHRAVEKQHLGTEGRSRGNGIYADIPGVSVAGMVDASLTAPGRLPGTPDEVTTDTLKANILKEGSEELGLGPEAFENIRITGIAQDKVKIHDEILYMADTPLTAEEVVDASRKSNRNKNLGPADFEEKFFTIDATPEALEAMLTQVRCPLPPTHAATLVAAGYISVLEQHGLPAAEEWSQKMQKAVTDHYASIDKQVMEFYAEHPEAATIVPERYWRKGAPVRNIQRYDPAYTPEEQGLPALEDEMIRVGLTPEHRRIVESAYLFDVDGVLADPQQKQVVETALFDEIAQRLERGEPVALSSGRSTGWVQKQVVAPLSERLQDASLLAGLCIIGEKGGAWTVFDEQGSIHHGSSPELAVPDELKANVAALVRAQHKDTLSIDAGGETLISIDMPDGRDVPGLEGRQQLAIDQLTEMLHFSGLDDAFQIDRTATSIDIQSTFAGQALGADRFLQLLRDRGIAPKQFKAFGSSASDIRMADELQRRGHQVEFVYVGEPDQLSGTDRKYSVRAMGSHGKGALEYLRTQQ
jgi:hypothetical protein